MVDIIIPAYNSHLTIPKTLESIANQKLDFKINVYVVDDCSTIGYSEIIKKYNEKLSIKELTLMKNSGPGIARQYGVDNSNSKYIIFIDSDDVLYNEYAIQNLFYVIEYSNFDVVVSDFIEETKDGIIEYFNDNVWLHGKIYKRAFLKEKNIKFNETRANEDNGFNQLILLCDAKVGYITEKTYIWKNNLDSITRKNNYDYAYSGILGYIYNISWAIENALIRNGNLEKISKLAFASLVATYYYYLEFMDYKDSYKFLEYIKKIKKYCDKNPLDKNEKNDIMKRQFDCLINNQNRKKLLVPKITFQKFLNMVDNI